MAELEKVIKGLNCCLNGLMQCESCPFNDGETVPKCVQELRTAAIELLKALRWISVKDRLPEVVGSYIIAGKQRYPGEPWEYFTDVAESHGSYIDDFWDTFNDWIEGQETHVTHWMPLPEPPKEGT